MKKIYILSVFLFALCAFFAPKHAKATHAAGGELIYVHISDSTYQFFFKFYRDCTGVSEPGSVSLCMHNSCTNQTTNTNMAKWQGTLPPDNRANGSPVSAGCSQYTNKCDNPSSVVPGYREWWYSTIQTLPLACNTWTFGVSIAARNISTNINGGNLYVETEFNSAVSWNNSSPFFSVKPIPYVCLNQPYSYNNGALDSDGDSLWSNVINPLNANTCSGTPGQVGLRNPQAGGLPNIAFPNNPIQTTNSFVLNNANGQMSFTASLLGAATLTMRTQEFRNGTLIGSIMRDVQVQVLPCSTQAPVLGLDTSSAGGGAIFGGVSYGCIDQKLDFCFDIKSTDTAAILLAEDNLGTAIPGATMTYTNLRNDSIRGCFSWTPTSNDVGAHSFIVTIKDSTCKPPGILLQYARTIDLYIWGPIEATPDTNICNGQPAYLGVNGGGNYSWTPGASLNNPNSPSPIATPTTTTTYVVTSNLNNYCPNLNKDTVTVSVEQGPAINGQNDLVICPDFATQLDVGIIKQSGVTYGVTWTPATGLSNNAIENPILTTKVDGTYIAEISSSVNRCNTYDTVNIDVLDGFSISNPDTAICRGESVVIRGTGDGRYTYSWSSDDPTPTYTSPTAIVNTITPSDTGIFTYTLTASHAVCPNNDSLASIAIEVQPNPSVSVNPDAAMCFGDTMRLTGVVQPSTYSKYTHTWTPGAALDNPNVINPIFTANVEGQTRVLLTTTTSANCSDTASVELTVYPANFLTLPNDTAICPGDSFKVAMTTPDAVVYYWAPDFNISNINDQQPRVWPVTDQVFTVYGKDSTGCLDTNEIYVAVRPRAVLDIPDTVTIYPGESYQMDPAGNALYYSWFPSLGLDRTDISNPLVRPKVNTRYIVNARTEAGCTVTDSVTVLVKNDSYLDLPNAFSPGMRGNSMLKILRRGDAELKNFTVYNRWGVKVFETTDINQGWDGTVDGDKQPMGVYIYTIEAITPSGRTVNKQGNITLIR